MSAMTSISKNYTSREMPECKGMKAFVLPGAFYGACVALMAEAGFGKANTVEDADVVVFIGGEDINPKLYDAKAHRSSFWTDDRDFQEEFFYRKAQRLNKVCFGICRGAQFLHAMNGGKLWQNVNNHGGPDHVIYDIDDDVYVTATSLHHQMLQFNKDMEVIACTKEQVATKFEEADLVVHVDKETDDAAVELEIEAGCYALTQCFFVQGHPEIGNEQYRSWTMNKLFNLMLEWGAKDRIADEPYDDSEGVAA